MAELKEGRKAPDFTLPASTGGKVKLSSFRGESYVVLYFYPRDNTPGCTKEACAFRDTRSKFKRVGAEIIGVSSDDLESHEKFVTKNGLNFPLLSDTDAKVATKYGVYQEKKQFGKTAMGIVRTTFVIDKEGVIRSIFPKVKVDEHAEEVLAAVKAAIKEDKAKE